MRKLLAIAACLVLGSAVAGATWSRMSVQSVSGVTFRGEAVAGFKVVYIADAVNPDLCLLVLRDTASGQFSTTMVPRISCDVHGAAQ